MLPKNRIELRNRYFFQTSKFWSKIDTHVTNRNLAQHRNIENKKKIITGSTNQLTEVQ